MLSDPKSEIIRAFGLLDESAAGSYSDGVAHPIIIVADTKGVVRHRFSEVGYVTRPQVDAVLDALRRDRGERP